MSQEPLISGGGVSEDWRPTNYWKLRATSAYGRIMQQQALLMSHPPIRRMMVKSTAIAMVLHPASTLYSIFGLLYPKRPTQWSDYTRPENPWWASVCFLFFLLPMILIRCSLSFNSLKKTRALWEERFASSISFRMLLKTNASIMWREIRSERLLPHEESYIKLYRMVDGAFGNFPWLLFTVYIFVRLQFLTGIHFHIVGHSLALNAALGMYNIYSSWDFAKTYSKVLTGGSVRALFMILSNLGEGYAHLSILIRIRTQQEVLIDEDLSSLSPLGATAIGRALMTSVVVRTCQFHGTNLEKSELLNTNNDRMAESYIKAWMNSQTFWYKNKALLRSISFEPALKVKNYEWMKWDEYTFLESIKNGDRFVYSRDSPKDSMSEAIINNDMRSLKGALASSQVTEEHRRLAVALDRWEAILMFHHDNPQFFGAHQEYLVIAAQMDSKACVELLLCCVKKQCNLASALKAAAENKCTELVGMLLSARGDPNLVDLCTQMSPVYAAASVNAAEVMAALLAARGDPNLKQQDGASPMVMAAQENAAEVMAALLVARGDPNLRHQQQEGVSPVFMAAKENAAEVMAALLAARGDPNLRARGGGSPVYAAAQENAAKVIPALLAARGDPNLQEQDGVSPVFMAAQENRAQVMPALLAARGDPNLRDMDGKSPVYMAAANNAAQVMPALLAARGDPNVQEQDGKSPVFEAAQQDSAEVMPALLAARGDPNLRDVDGHSPLFTAATNNSAQVMPALLAARGDPNLQKQDGASPVFLAAQMKAAQVMPALLAARGDPNLQTKNGISPLFVAAYINAAEVMQALLAARGDPNQKKSGEERGIADGFRR